MMKLSLFATADSAPFQSKQYGSFSEVTSLNYTQLVWTGALEFDPDLNNTKLIYSGSFQNITKNNTLKVPMFPGS